MRAISAKEISRAVEELCIKANLHLRPDVLMALKTAQAREPAGLSKKMLSLVIENARVARKEKLAICQDTGLPAVFVQLGQKIKVTGDITNAVNKGVEASYSKACLRNSVAGDPILRKGPFKFSPAVIHTETNNSDRIKITFLPKGFGCENKSKVKMFNPTATQKEIKDFVVSVVKEAGPDACPPFIVGVGIGGTQDTASLLAKKALLRPVNKRSNKKHIQAMEKDLLELINKLDIGVMGLGGKITALAVNIEIFPTHIAGLPVAVNISCHALRSASKVI